MVKNTVSSYNRIMIIAILGCQMSKSQPEDATRVCLNGPSPKDDKRASRFTPHGMRSLYERRAPFCRRLRHGHLHWVLSALHVMKLRVSTNSYGRNSKT